GITTSGRIDFFPLSRRERVRVRGPAAHEEKPLTPALWRDCVGAGRSPSQWEREPTKSDTMAEPVLMIEEDESLAAMLSEYRGTCGFEVTTRATASDGLKLLRHGGFAALVLDIMLPDMDGFEVCRRVRAESDIPILMLTARGDELDRIVGLE